MEKLELTVDFKTTSGMFDKDVYIKPYAVLDLCQSIAGRHAYNLGFGADKLLEDNLGWITARQTFEFYQTPFLFDTIRITTFPHPQNKFEFYREYEAYNLKGEILFRSLSLWVILDFTNNRLSSKPIDFKGEFREGSYFKGVPKPKNAKNLGIKIGERIVVKADIDMYNHLNNAKYADIIFDFAGLDAKEYRSLTISYQSQALLNDVIEIYKYQEDNMIYITGIINDKICFTSEVRKRG